MADKNAPNDRHQIDLIYNQLDKAIEAIEKAKKLHDELPEAICTSADFHDASDAVTSLQEMIVVKPK